jgi:hypothetical protein
MTRILSWAGALAVASLAAAACSDDDILALDSMGNGGSAGAAAGSGGTASRAGASGSAGSGLGSAGAAGGGGRAGTGGGSGAGGSSGMGGSSGTGSSGNGAAPDAGAPDASVADAGACADAACECAVDVITALPYSQQWQTTGDDEADVVDLEGCQLCDNTADHIVTFTAAATATYRFFASSGGDVELAVYPGDCTAAPNDVACGEDIDLQGEDYNDQVDVEIEQGATVTVVVGESCEENGGAGTLTIQVAP